MAALNSSVDFTTSTSSTSVSPASKKRTKRSTNSQATHCPSSGAYCRNKTSDYNSNVKLPSGYCSDRSVDYCSNNICGKSPGYGSKLVAYCSGEKTATGYCGKPPQTSYCCAVKSEARFRREEGSSAPKRRHQRRSVACSNDSQPPSPVVGRRTSPGREGHQNCDVESGASSGSDSISLSGSCSESDSRKASPVLSPPLIPNVHHSALSSLAAAGGSSSDAHLFAAVAAAAASSNGATAPSADSNFVESSPSGLLSPNGQRQAALALSLSLGLSGRLGSGSSNYSATLDTPPVNVTCVPPVDLRQPLIIVERGGVLVTAPGGSSTTAGDSSAIRHALSSAPSPRALATTMASSLTAAMLTSSMMTPSSMTSSSSSMMTSPAALNILPSAVALSSTTWPTLQDFDGLTAAGFDGSLSGLSDLAGTAGYMGDMLELVKRQSSHSAPAASSMCSISGENYFQFILMAPTSSAVRLNEEPLTYLNQGQSYEIKCKRLNAVDSSVQSRVYKSVVRVGFHDRRQKFQEKELLTQWKQLHNCSKIIDADIPMSFNVFNAKTELSSSHIEFSWDCSKNTSIFIKINCISTEFTAHKHGGEKGVPFRLQVDTYAYSDVNQQGLVEANNRQLNSAYAQIKVFKTKGADRKIKTDRERAEKRLDKEKYQPSYDYTIMMETFPISDSTVSMVDSDLVTSPACQQHIKVENHANSCLINNCAKISNFGGSQSVAMATNNGNGSLHNGRDSVISSQAGTNSPSLSTDELFPADALLPESSTIETSDWLRRQRFGHFLKIFSSFSGTDLLRVSRDDFIKLCGMADGIRLYNALQHKPLQPKLNLYMCVPGAPAYHAVFLKALTLSELVQKVCDLIQVQPTQIYDVYCQGPDGINVHVNDEVVQNLSDKSRFTIDAMKCGEESECYRILLKSSGETPS